MATEPTTRPITFTPPRDFSAPASSESWNLRSCCHLIRRLAFGASHEQIDALLPLGPQKAVEKLFDFDPKADPFAGLLDQLEGFVRMNDPKIVGEWWVYRMVNSPNPVQERIALFWHSHFATSAAKVENSRYLQDQIDLFRTDGLGSFRELLVKVGREPAMLVWLDGQSNRKGKSNENYGREVMELFTLGIGNYTENDVKELARAFTGWHINDGEGVFNKRLWDEKPKTIFGETAEFNDESAVDLLLKQPPAAKFIARKLLRNFLHPEPKPEHVDYFAKRIVDLKWEIKPILIEMCSCKLFYSDWAYRSKIKSPADLCVGAVRAINGGGGRVNTQFLRDQMSRMGQNLLYPPNVKGWDGEELWINGNTVLVRFNFGLALATQRQNEFSRKTEFTNWIKKHSVQTPDDLIDYYAKVLMDGQVDPDLRAKLVKYCNTGENDKPAKFVVDGKTINSKGRGVMHLMLSTPESQLS